MFENLKNRIFEHRLKKQPPRNIRFPHYEDVKDILLIYESDIMEKNTAIKEIARKLQDEGKNVTTWGYVDRKDVSSPQLPNSRMTGKSDLSLTGALDKKLAEDLRSAHYDLLIDLTQHPCLPLHYAAMLANCTFKAGRHIVDGLHDLMIDTEPDDNPNVLYKNIMHFITTIKSND